MPECLACRAELATHDSLDAALRRMVAPEPGERLWRAVRDGMSGGRGRQHGRASMRAPRLAGGFGAVAAVVLLSLGFAQLLRNHTSTVSTNATPIPTAVPAAPAADGPHLNWQQAELPTKLLANNQDNLSYAVVPGHGESAYACHATVDSAGTTLTLYRTTDRGLHWTALKQFKEPDADVSLCMIEIDRFDVNRILIEMGGRSHHTSQDAMWFELSEDGGATWTGWNDDSTAAVDYKVTTANGKVYALRRALTDSARETQHLSVSADHLRTWQPVDPVPVGDNQSVSNFWVSPDGELLAEVMTGIPPASATATATSPSGHWFIHTALWRSTDGGAHWSAFPAPTLASDRGALSFIVGQPVAGQPWQICAPNQPQDSASTASIVCTFDGGRTWSARPLLCVAAPFPHDVQPSGQYSLASDGTLLVVEYVTNHLGLYRLPRGSTVWQYLGPISGRKTFFFASTPNGGILWAHEGGTFPGQLGGAISDDQVVPDLLTTATYP